MTATATTVALPKLGTTLFSFTLEMRKPAYTLEGMIDRVAELGLGPGLELVGFQSLRGYPRVSTEVVSSFRDQCERTGLEHSAMSMNLDLGLHRGRLLSEDEALDYLEPQIAVSRQMGFPVCKASVIPTRSFLEGLVRILEKHGGLKFGFEVHSPMAVDSPEILTLRELYEAIDSPLLGFTPDFSASMHSVPPSLIAAHQESGMNRDLTDLAIEVWNSDTTMPQKFGRFADEAPALGATAADMGKLQMLLTMHGRQDPRRWSEIMDRVVHVHAKFYGIDAHGDEPSIDNATIIDVLVDAGYTGYLSSEWEGHAYTDAVSGWDMVAGQHELFRRLLSERAARG
jgi:sugar phosphate isomerase/epimerase